MKDKLSKWYDGLSPNKRKAVIGIGGLILVALIWAGIGVATGRYVLA